LRESRDTRAPEDASLDGDFHPEAIYVGCTKRLVRSWRIAFGSKREELVEFWFAELASNADVRAKEDVRTPSERVYTEAAIV
jgi:hypothetical protein